MNLFNVSEITEIFKKLKFRISNFLIFKKLKFKIWN